MIQAIYRDYNYIQEVHFGYDKYLGPSKYFRFEIKDQYETNKVYY